MLESLLQNQRKIQRKYMLYQNCKSLYLPHRHVVTQKPNQHKVKYALIENTIK